MAVVHLLQVMAAPQLAHLPADPGGAAQRSGVWLASAALERIGQDGGQQGSLLTRQVGCAACEMVTRGCFGAEDAGPPFGAVEVQLEDALLG